MKTKLEDDRQQNMNFYTACKKLKEQLNDTTLDLFIDSSNNDNTLSYICSVDSDCVNAYCDLQQWKCVCNPGWVADSTQTYCENGK